MPELAISDFPQFFFDLHERAPFPWQSRLAATVCSDGWPRVIDLPTASGKTAAIDIALFAMAVRGPEVARRVFFVVDRRLVVNQAYERMKRVRRRIIDAKEGTLRRVRERLCELGRTSEPLRVYEMRGGAFRDEAWVRSPEQPMVIASTVDQTGSRLLFRGCGVSTSTWPTHAGMIGNDSLIILDEAHCSKAFGDTLAAVAEYRSPRWASRALDRPFSFVKMTATPDRAEADGKPFRIEDEDREPLRERLFASKPTRLVEVKARRNDFGPVARELVSQAEQLAARTGGRRVAIFANRVRTAKQIHELLRTKHADTATTKMELVIGRMRGVDRDALAARLTPVQADTRRTEEGAEPLRFVISTQCLEVGADFDFDVVVSECASIDALLQRFGRLDRLGEFRKAEGGIAIASWQAEGKQPDAVYGEALAKTWKWLNAESGGSGTVNLGIEAADGEPSTIAERLMGYEHAGALRMGGKSAPVLLPVHLDLLCQTGPAPDPDLAIEAFLHGPQEGTADVNVVWRKDLDQAEGKDWKAIVAMCPPSSRETMAVPIGVFRRWFSGVRDADTDESDIEGASKDDGDVETVSPLRALIWTGEHQTEGPVERADRIRPGQTIVLAASADGRNELGYVPPDGRADVGDEAPLAMKRGDFCLRLHPLVMAEWAVAPGLDALNKLARADGSDEDTLMAALREYLANIEGDAWPKPVLNELGALVRLDFEAHPSGIGYVLTGRRSGSRKSGGDRQTLRSHTADVVEAVRLLSAHLAPEVRASLESAAKYHDWGKVDLRYQAWLRGGDTLAARYAPEPIAKSGRHRLPRQTSAGLPAGFRHESLSILFAEKGGADELALHEVGAHHGECRPFAPAVMDASAGCVEYDGIEVCSAEQWDRAAHRLSSGVADRFWRLTREYGWWGLAYLDAIFRIADWNASGEGAEEGGVDDGCAASGA
jgi:CRISPR-associated endonuclease/helicase Cas3